MVTIDERIEGERIRAREIREHIMACCAAMVHDIESTTPPGANAGQSITEAANRLATTLAKLDAYMRAKDDQVERVQRT